MGARLIIPLCESFPSYIRSYCANTTMSHRERERDDHPGSREPEYDRDRRRRDERDGRSDERRRAGDDRRRERDSPRDGRRERDAEKEGLRERDNGKRRGHDADVREGKRRCVVSGRIVSLTFPATDRPAR